MDFKKFWKESFAGFVVKNLLLAIAIFLALTWITLFIIDIYTHHGEAEIVPDMKGLYVEEAENILREKGLYPKIIDSVYVRDKKAGIIIEQVPPPKSTLKKNRPVYLIINSTQVQKVPVPEVIDVSSRQAIAMLQSVGLDISKIEYKPSEFKDLVIDIKYNGVSILPGTKIPESSSVVLVVGSGYGEGMFSVPSLKGMGLQEAKQAALSNSFVIGMVNFDIPPKGNDADYFIYRQLPKAGTSMPAGSRIDIWLTSSPAKLLEDKEEDQIIILPENDEVFF
ncbi:MAG TPA: PASTA domain-containing protein [Paludibacteraceae bacterium]|jgi:beta-lactam-binding protein with PASTA domain|nr:PASTA domain-containing protein [Paludibacteraceae bacterium]